MPSAESSQKAATEDDTLKQTQTDYRTEEAQITLVLAKKSEWL